MFGKQSNISKKVKAMENKKNNKVLKGLIINILVKLGIFAILYGLAFGVFFGVFRMDSYSMTPNVNFRDVLLYNRMSDIVIDDFVVYEVNNEEFVGRVVGLPGDNVRIDANGFVYRNGSILFETNIYNDIGVCEPVEVTLAQGQYFVLCDDRQIIDDSRTFGPISESSIKGVVFFNMRRYGV